jgi:hypothetical protein
MQQLATGNSAIDFSKFTGAGRTRRAAVDRGAMAAAA